MPSGHRSHQMGLDADIWYRLDAPPSAVDADQWKMVQSGGRGIDRARWTSRQAQTLRLAGEETRGARIFVNPANNQAQCGRTWRERARSMRREWVRGREGWKEWIA